MQDQKKRPSRYNTDFETIQYRDAHDYAERAPADNGWAFHALETERWAHLEGSQFYA